MSMTLSIYRVSIPVLIRGLDTEFVDEHDDAFLSEVGPKVRSGEIRYREDIADGLDKAPEACIGTLAGRNFGKALVRVS